MIESEDSSISSRIKQVTRLSAAKDCRGSTFVEYYKDLNTLVVEQVEFPCDVSM